MERLPKIMKERMPTENSTKRRLRTKKFGDTSRSMVGRDLSNEECKNRQT